MNSHAISKLIRDQMRYQKYYSHDDLYEFYTDEMCLDAFCKYPVLSEKTIRNYVAVWSVNSTWLGRVKLGREVVFYKNPPPKIELLTVREHLDGLINHFKEFFRWAK